jgi:hypothetical protein
MKGTPVSLRDQIALAEQRVRLEKLNLRIAVHGLRSSARTVVSGPIGLTALFVAAAIAGSIGARKLSRR